MCSLNLPAAGVCEGQMQKQRGSPVGLEGLVDLLDVKALVLRQEEVDEHCAQGTAASKEEEHAASTELQIRICGCHVECVCVMLAAVSSCQSL